MRPDDPLGRGHGTEAPLVGRIVNPLSEGRL